ncbi:hypothetical protein L2737_06785 [Shewanella electrodiphila]|uniref:Carbohydrate-binding module family 96 domain-containing protein n=1 Tax=Shewanella electrodiphila TaxID=934143 RepID=A0ABT0KMF5_9GAMM|nr:hypothetical protein [Shewanella electrodiphila]MCL1045036.1 hypothetical protein [Shewanella electrodiphila]
MKYKVITMTAVAYAVCSFMANAEERVADANNIEQIIEWASDGVTTQITFPSGVYEFSNQLKINNNNLMLNGTDKDSVILKLVEAKQSLINATGNNLVISNLTLDGNNLQKSFGHRIFFFNRSEGHRFDNVIFKQSLQDAISAPQGWATEGLEVRNSEFINIKGYAIHIFNRNTLKRGGDVISSIKPVIIESSTFREGYGVGVVLDAGNDRTHDYTDEDGNRVGRRYTESVNMNGSIIDNNIFEKSTKFHFSGVQASHFTLSNNTFLGITDDAPSGANGIHFEQFTSDMEIYDNEFYMDDTIAKAVPYISIAATEGHKRVFQETDSSTYPTWTYKVDGSNERRASTSCASTGHIDKSCKRDVHAYGPKNIYIAGNYFHESEMITDYVAIKEGENIQIGARKDGSIALNTFAGGTEYSRKITLSGHDEGNCDVVIHPGQNVSLGNVIFKGVSFDSSACLETKPIIVNDTVIGGDKNPDEGDDNSDADFDEDGIPNNVDPDDDNDGIADDVDAFPFNIKYAAAAAEFRFDVIADADVDSSRADSNLGTPAALKLFVDRRHSYLKFNITGIDDVSGDIITSKLWQFNRVAKPIIGNINIFESDNNWEELTVTWNAKHDLDNLITSVEVDGTSSQFSADINVTSDGVYTYGINADVDGQLNSKEATGGQYGAFIEIVKAVPSADFDQDGLPDLVDIDDDNDGVNDEVDLFPFDAHESKDFDQDGVGDNSDLDDDNDNVDDSADVFPFDATEWADFDADGLGDNADLDDDNDGVNDEIDFLPYDNQIGILGDIDGDFDLDVRDLIAFIHGVVTGSVTHYAYDFNADNIVNHRDIRGFVKLVHNNRDHP